VTFKNTRNLSKFQLFFQCFKKFILVNGELAAILRAAFAAARRFGAPHGAFNNSVGAAHAGADGDGPEGTVLCAGAAFHTGILLDNPGFFFIYLKHAVGANYGAHSAAGAFIAVQRQCRCVF
jgi:hypothetical protein